MNIVFCSLRGSPGVTTLATICAAQWADPCVLLEADLHGGVLGQRYGAVCGNSESGELRCDCQARDDRRGDLVVLSPVARRGCGRHRS